MTVEKSFENSKLTITVSGKLNTITSQQFAEELKDLDAVTELVIDFAELEQITSAGLRVLLDVQCNMTERNNRKRKKKKHHQRRCNSGRIFNCRLHKI